MSTEYFTASGYPSTGALGVSASARSEFANIETGFSKLPTLAGNGSKIVAVNSGGSGLEAITTTGTGNGVRATSPTLVTPVLGVATCTTLNKLTITAPATSATLTVADGKTLQANSSIAFTGTDGKVLSLTGDIQINGNGKTFTLSNTLTLAGTDSTTMTFPSTSASIARIDAAQTFTGTQTFSGAIRGADGTAAAPQFSFTSDTNTGMYSFGADTIGFSTNGLLSVKFTSTAGLGGSGIDAYDGSGNEVMQLTGSDIILRPQSQTYAYVRCSASTDLVLNNSGISTSAIAGFVLIPGCAGTPTGVPTNAAVGFPMVYNSSANRLYIYNGGWKSVLLS